MTRRFRSVWLLWLLLVPAARAACAEIYRVDTALKSYFHECRDRIRDPEVVAMCDTLHARAAAQGDLRMQVMALCARVDHYYYTGASSDRIAAEVERVKAFCREHPSREFLRFYYGVWANRLVATYTKQHQANAAVYETCRMLTEAQQDDFPAGEINCYRLLADIYFSQANFRLAYENYGAAIRLSDKHGIVEVPMGVLYAAQAECALELDMPDSAVALIARSSRSSIRAPYPRFMTNRVAMFCDLATGRYAAAERTLRETERLFDSVAGLSPYRDKLYAMQMACHMHTGRLREALASGLKLRNDTTLRVEERLRRSVDKQLGDIYRLMGDNGRAAASYRDYIRSTDSLGKEVTRMASNDLSGIIEIVRLQNETKELALGMQQRRLRNTYVYITLLGIVLLMALLFAVRMLRFNRRLRASEARVVAQNEELRAAGEELRRAKEDVEQISRMKSDFIQNMSHEVRTPLNSIVGFSQVLASQFRGDRAMGEYASIIEASSGNLLRLVDDVLDIAFLDRAGTLPPTDCCDINQMCTECADANLSQLRPGVSLTVDSMPDNPVLFVNSSRIRQVVMHLLHNAAKFTAEGSVVLKVECLQEQRMLRFSVTDTGPGIPTDKQEAVFERFVKLDAFTQGSGLGLPICRVIAQKLGGSLRLDTSYTGGCRFVFEVPFEPVEN